LEAVRIDDSIRPFQSINKSDLDPSERIDVSVEHFPTGRETQLEVEVVRMRLRIGESRSACIARFERWLTAYALPPGARFALEESREAGKLDGFVARILSGDSALVPGDVVTAIAHPDPGAEAIVVVSLTPQAAERFANLTEDWQRRRIAILVDGIVVMAPKLAGRISGGRLAFVLGGENAAAQRANVEQMAHSLSPR
jgi:hypothetical protein